MTSPVSFVDTLSRAVKLTAPDFRRYVEGIFGLPSVGPSGIGRTLSDGVLTSASYQMQLPARVSYRGMRLVYVNWANTASSGAEAAGLRMTTPFGPTVML